MTLKIGFYDVDIVARANVGEADAERDTLALLAHISIVYDDASRHLESQGYKALARECKEDGDEIWGRVKEVMGDV